MIIQCTKKLREEMEFQTGALEDPPAEREPLFCWHANLITLQRKKTVVLINDSSKYIIVLFGLNKTDFQEMGNHIRHGMREAFREEFIAEDIIEQYIQTAMPRPGQITCTRTKNRSLVARLNHACELVAELTDFLDEYYIDQPVLSKEASSYLISVGKSQYVQPNEALISDLEALASRPVIRVRAAVLRVTLELKKRQVWRRLVVPVNMAMERFHRVLQYAFGWQDTHLHEFYIYGEEKSPVFGEDSHINHPAYNREGLHPVMNLVCTEEGLNYDEDYPIYMEKGVRLSQYLPARMKYIYDFGDNWQHFVEVEEILEYYDKNYPICLEGQGNAPPESVGGSGGYERFLEIMADEKHPEHQHLREWGINQGYHDFDWQRVNLLLKYV